MTTMTQPDTPTWTDTDGPDAFADDFYEIRVTADRGLDYDDVRRLSGCLGYALREVLAGEALSEPTVTFERGPGDGARATVLEYGYDSTKSRRDDPDYALAFEKARAYIADGTPVRKTDRTGAGTKGTRLVEGLSAPCALTFRVR